MLSMIKRCQQNNTILLPALQNRHATYKLQVPIARGSITRLPPSDGHTLQQPTPTLYFSRSRSNILRIGTVTAARFRRYRQDDNDGRRRYKNMRRAGRGNCKLRNARQSRIARRGAGCLSHVHREQTVVLATEAACARPAACVHTCCFVFSYTRLYLIILLLWA